MVIILKRRIVNELMTTYLPTVLILIIVYTTNFFKPFFFEAVVTVNLTSLLVLTTLFISVSGLLGKPIILNQNRHIFTLYFKREVRHRYILVRNPLMPNNICCLSCQTRPFCSLETTLWGSVHSTH